MKKLRNSLLLVVVLLFGVFGIFTACNGNKVTINFEVNGGEQIAAVSVEKDTEYTLPTPTRSGYSFDGWFTTSDCSGDPVVSIVAKEDCTVYAKWTQQYTLTLDAGSGKLSQTSLSLKAGDNLYEAVRDLVPSPADSDHKFGAWFRGNTALTEESVMPAEDLTLTARYTVKYVIHVNEQNLEGEGYTAVSDIEGYDYAGVTPSVEKTGFTLNAGHDGTVAVKALSDTASQNVFTLFYDRNNVRVTFNPNYPENVSGNSQSVTEKFGASVDFPRDFEIDGYALIGWSKDRAATTIDYESSYIYESLFNKDGVNAPESSFVIDSDVVNLYAVWAKGYVDLFGSSDLIYFFDKTSSDVYLYRQGTFFKGVCTNANTGAFRFTPTADVLIEGLLYEDTYSFSYRDDSRREIYYFYPGTGNTVSRDTTLELDAYSGIKYTAFDENGTPETANGTYRIDEQGYCIASFEVGGPEEVSGKENVTMLLGTISGGTHAFMIRNDDEFAMGTINRFVDPDRYYTGAYQIVLNGFGTASFNTGSQQAAFRYTLEGEVLTLFNSAGSPYLVAHVFKTETMWGYYLYSETYDGVYTMEDKSNSDTLTLDGMCQAVYKKGDQEIKGYYMLYSTTLGGILCEVTVSEDETYSFIIHNNTETITGGDGAEDQVKITRVFKPSNSTYAEYALQDSQYRWKIPLLVLDEDKVGEAYLYGWSDYVNSQGVFARFATLTYEIIKETNTAVFTVTKFDDSAIKAGKEAGKENASFGGFELDNCGFDVSQLESFVCGLVATSNGNAFVIHSYKLKDSEDTAIEKKYTNEKEETLTLVAGFAFYDFQSENEEGETVKARLVGQYQINETTLRMTVSYIVLNGVLEARSGYLYFELDEENSKFTYLAELYGILYSITSDGATDRTKSLNFDGKGGVVYTDGENTYTGTYKLSEETSYFGSNYYTFTENGEGGKTFNFMLYSSSSSSFFVIYDENMRGVYNSEDEKTTLILDGFAWANYTNELGEEFESVYLYDPSTNSLRIVVNNSYLYIDLKDNKTYTVRGYEYTTNCLWFDNWTVHNDYYFELDGYGKLIVHSLEDDSIVDTGTYDKSEDGDHFVFHFKINGEEKTLSGTLGVLTISNRQYVAFLVEYPDREGMYIDPTDWSVLTLDAYGNAIKTDKLGRSVAGRFQLITERILYFSSDNDSCIYYLDKDNNIAQPQSFESYAYYTENLETLNFQKGGYVSIEGEVCYYIVDEDGNIVIYRKAQEGESNRNEYGYVEDKTFGKFEETKQFNNKTYYRTDGYGLTFTRAEATKNDYPVTVGFEDDKETPIRKPITSINFSPIGDGSFTVNGYCKVEGDDVTNYPCVVVRREENGELKEFYILLRSGGLANFRFDITVTYKGDSVGQGVNNFTVERGRIITEYSSYNYYYLRLLLSVFGGTSAANSLPNTFGVVSTVSEIEKDGNVLDPVFNAEFGEDTPLFDYNGNPFTFTDISDYETVSSQGQQMITVNVKGEDEYDYRLRVVVSYQQMFGTYVYQIYAFTRVQSFDVSVEGKNYRIEVERYIYTENNAAPGALLNVAIYEKGDDDTETLIEPEMAYVATDGTIRYIVRTFDEESGDIVSSKYYIITLKEHISETVSPEPKPEPEPEPEPDVDAGDDEEGEEEEEIPVVEYYESASFTIVDVKTYYNKDDKSIYVDIDESTDTIYTMFMGRYYYIVSETVKNEDGTYTVTVGQTKYTVSIDGDKNVTITQIDSEDEQEEEDA